MDASRAATGMLEVLAMRVVRSVMGLPLFGSSSSLNSFSTCVISLPRSPQPTYTMMSASHHLASWCCVIVLPVPKPPGTAAAPPLAMGNRLSMTRWPVTSGRLMASRRATGRGVRMGHFCARYSVRSSPPGVFTLQMGS